MQTPAEPHSAAPAETPAAPAPIEAAAIEPAALEPAGIAPAEIAPAAIEPAENLPAPEILAPEPLLVESAPVVAAEPAAPREITLNLKRAPKPEPGAWARKAIDAWSENAEALCAFAQALSTARTPADVVALQSRFLNERYDAALRQSGEFAELARNLAMESTRPFPKFFTRFAA